MRRLLPLAALLLSATALAQPSRLDRLLTPDSLSDRATASLLTMLPGDEVYSLWGHSALRIADPETGLDETYNYGTFDFEQPGFLVRFLRGHLDYMLASAPFEEEVWKYKYLERPMIEQRLALAPETVRALFDALRTNALPENRDYRYEFLRDNCSTRLLDVVDSALVRTGRPRLALPPADSAQTFRELLDPYVAEHPWYDFGTNLGLGAPIDETATVREKTFLPLGLMRIADETRVGDRLLVAERDTVFWILDASEPRPAFPWPTVLAWLALAGAVGATLAMRRRLRPLRLRRWGARGDGLLFFAAGLAGVILLALWFGTDHYVTAANSELLWLWPTHLVAAFGLARVSPSALWRRYALVAGVVTALVVALWWLWPEPMHPAGVPLALLLAFRAAMRARVRD